MIVAVVSRSTQIERIKWIHIEEKNGRGRGSLPPNCLPEGEGNWALSYSRYSGYSMVKINKQANAFRHF